MVLSTVSLVPVAVAFVAALGVFGAWTAYLIRADRRLAASRAAEAAVSAVGSVAPIVAMVTPVAAARAWDRPHFLVAAPELVPEPEQCPVVRSGSFCTVVGASGITASGTEMVCSAENGARPRWRRAVRELQRTA